MSDQGQPPQIDDVLSAIRALVDGKAEAARPNVPAVRLLLTPAQRVSDDSATAPVVSAMDAVLNNYTDAQWEPEEGEAAPSGAWETFVEGEPSLFFGRAPAFGASEEQQEPPRAADEAPLQSSGAEEALLRALVKQVLREELQGDLGERITRNVRKLVRREIYRALAARELD